MVLTSPLPRTYGGFASERRLDCVLATDSHIRPTPAHVWEYSPGDLPWAPVTDVGPPGRSEMHICAFKIFS